MSIADDLRHLRGLKGRNGQWSAFCPVCENDKTQGDRHLGISIGKNDKLLLNCMRGCGFENILKAAGLWVPDSRDLRNNRNRNAPGAVDRRPPAKVTWTVETFVETFVTGKPKTKDLIIIEAGNAGLAERKVNMLLSAAEAQGLIHPWEDAKDRRRKVSFATEPHPKLVADSE